MTIKERRLHSQEKIVMKQSNTSLIKPAPHFISATKGVGTALAIVSLLGIGAIYYGSCLILVGCLIPVWIILWSLMAITYPLSLGYSFDITLKSNNWLVHNLVGTLFKLRWLPKKARIWLELEEDNKK
jgi:hypothetical protein